jgi:hypothetical protein
MREALSSIVDHAYDRWDINRIQATTDLDNHYRRTNFRPEMNIYSRSPWLAHGRSSVRYLLDSEPSERRTLVQDERSGQTCSVPAVTPVAAHAGRRCCAGPCTRRMVRVGGYVASSEHLANTDCHAQVVGPANGVGRHAGAVDPARVICGEGACAASEVCDRVDLRALRERVFSENGT